MNLSAVFHETTSCAMRYGFAYIASAIFVPASATYAQHTHGEATLMMGVEGSGGRIELRAPGDDLLGSEREPRTAAERATQQRVFDRLRSDGARLFRFAPALGCRVPFDSVGMVKGRGGHSEVFARWRIQCRRILAGSPIGFGVSAAFPRIERMSVQLLSDSAQVGRVIIRDRGTLIP